MIIPFHFGKLRLCFPKLERHKIMVCTEPCLHGFISFILCSTHSQKCVSVFLCIFRFYHSVSERSAHPYRFRKWHTDLRPFAGSRISCGSNPRRRMVYVFVSIIHLINHSGQGLCVNDQGTVTPVTTQTALKKLLSLVIANRPQTVWQSILTV